MWLNITTQTKTDIPKKNFARIGPFPDENYWQYLDE